MGPHLSWAPCVSDTVLGKVNKNRWVNLNLSSMLKYKSYCLTCLTISSRDLSWQRMSQNVTFLLYIEQILSLWIFLHIMQLIYIPVQLWTLKDQCHNHFLLIQLLSLIPVSCLTPVAGSTFTQMQGKKAVFLFLLEELFFSPHKIGFLLFVTSVYMHTCVRNYTKHIVCWNDECL